MTAQAVLWKEISELADRGVYFVPLQILQERVKLPEISFEAGLTLLRKASRVTIHARQVVIARQHPESLSIGKREPMPRIRLRPTISRAHPIHSGELKTCKACRDKKTLDQFHPVGRHGHKVDYLCKSCRGDRAPYRTYRT